MHGLSRRIMEHAEALSKATLCSTSLLNLCDRVSVKGALSWLARSGRLMRICLGAYILRIETRFGRCAPEVGKVTAAPSPMWSETILPCRRCRRQLPWPDDAESSSPCLSYLGP